MERLNVLVFPCGSEIAAELHRALAHARRFHLIGGSSLADHGSFVFEDYVGELPWIDQEDFLPALQQLITARQIELIFPAHDSAVVRLAEWSQGELLGPARAVTAPGETCRIARSKSATYAHFAGTLATPRVYRTAAEVTSFPVFVKPDCGQGSRGARRVASRAALEVLVAEQPDLLILEDLPGTEYTVDCFTDRHGRLRYAAGRARARTANGISVSTHRVADGRFPELAARINAALRFAGAWFFQLKARADGELVLLEIAPRIAGTSGYCRMRGVNLPLLSLWDALGHDVEIVENDYELEMDRQLYSRYRLTQSFASVYVDLDDTLVVNGEVNHRLLAALYRLRAAGTPLTLLTRHRARHGELARATLAACRIDAGLFTAIIELPAQAPKSGCMSGPAALLIDDSFRERRDAQLNAGAAALDVGEAIELFA